MKGFFCAPMLLMALTIICSSCNKEKKNPVFGDYKTVYRQVLIPASDTVYLYDQKINISYFYEEQIKVKDYVMYKSTYANYYTGGDVYKNTNWSLQYFPENDSIELRWNQYDITTSSILKTWNGVRSN
jgi:hypothetical protein